MEMKPIKVIMNNKHELKTEYVNSFAVYGNPVEFVLEFGYVDLPEVIQEKDKLKKNGKDLTQVVAVAKSRLVMPANQIQGLIQALQNQFDDMMRMQNN